MAVCAHPPLTISYSNQPPPQPFIPSTNPPPPPQPTTLPNHSEIHVRGLCSNQHNVFRFATHSVALVFFLFCYPYRTIPVALSLSHYPYRTIQVQALQESIRDELRQGRVPAYD
jgi:hypothetical protein